MLEGRNIDVLDGFPIRSASGPGQGLEGVGKVGRGRGNPPQNFDHQVSALMEGADISSRGMERSLPEIQPTQGGG